MYKLILFARITHSLRQTGLDTHSYEVPTITGKTDSVETIFLHAPVLVLLVFNSMLAFLALVFYLMKLESLKPATSLCF